MNVTELVAWYNLVFEVPFCMALAMLLLQATGLLHFGDGDADTDVAEHDATHLDDADGQDQGGEAEESSMWGRTLDLLGVGRVPLSIGLMTWCFLFGFIGWLGNQVFSGVGIPFITFWISLLAAFLGAFAGTALLTRLLVRYLPGTETYRIKSVDELSGLVAEAIYPITVTSGWARVRDQFGALHEVQVRTTADQERIPTGTRVVLMQYDVELRVFSCEKAEDFLTAMRNNESHN